MKKFLIALICSIGLSMSVQAADFSCPAVIYCPNTNMANCKNTPAQWGISQGSLQKPDTLIFTGAREEPTNSGQCSYASNDGADTLVFVSWNPVYQADRQAPRNRWDPNSVIPICNAYLYPSLCPFIIV